MKKTQPIAAQRSPEWFSQRRGKLTGSAVGAALGVNPYMTPAQLIRRLVRNWHGVESEFKGNIATEYGAMHEPIAMLAYTMKTGNAVHDVGFMVSDKYPWLGASPDGITSDSDDELAVLEIKCPFSQRDANPPVFKSAAEQPHYYAQMQIEMYCAGLDVCHFYQWAQHGDSLERVSIDWEWIKSAIPKLKAFHDQLIAELDNPDHLAAALPVIDTAQASILLTEYDNVCEVIDTATERKKQILAELVAMARDKPAILCGRRLSLVKRDGAVSYARAVRDLLPGADLSKYTGKPTEYWKLG